ncbi:MAG: hypothetical protein IJD74_05205 [Clostridia bacterium]|nr:hypothetical protein [Clostridia bacterium]
MAQRWTFEEDYIVYKFCCEQEYMDIEYESLNQLINKLTQAGFAERSGPAVYKRARDFTYLLRGWDVSRVSKQIKAIVETFNDESHKKHVAELQAYLNEKRQCKRIVVDDDLSYLYNNSDEPLHMVHTAKGKPFNYVLSDYIDASIIRPKTRIYRDVGMKQETYSAILRGKYKKVDRENVYRLCFGLRLNYDEAVKLIRSGGYAFRDDSVLDEVVEFFLRKGPQKADVNREKVKGKYIEKICYSYDTILIDSDLLESNESVLFWTDPPNDEDEK